MPRGIMAPDSPAPRSLGLMRQDGVTLTEVLAAILIMGVGLLALLTLFPLGLLAMREAIQEDRAAHASATLAAAARSFVSYYNVPPAALADLTAFLNNDDRYEDGEESGYVFTLAADAVLVAAPAAPGRTGTRRFCAHHERGVWECTPLEAIRAAEEGRALMRLEILSAAAYSAATLMALDKSGAVFDQVRAFLTRPGGIAEGMAAVDGDGDGHLSFPEILEIGKQSALLQPFIQSVRASAALGIADEDVALLPGVDLTTSTATAAALFEYDSLRWLTAYYVVQPGMERALIEQLNAAEAAGSRGQIHAERRLRRAFLEHVAAQAGKTLALDDAAVLYMLAAVH